jgi:mRNA interferase MazF
MDLIKRCSVCLVNLDPAKGSEIAKTRPAVVVSNDINNEVAETITVVPITKSKGKVYPFEVFIPSGTGGLDINSKVKANQIRTISKSRINSVIGDLSNDYMDMIEKAIKIHLDID